jgi:geranylgeranyl reductase family protein
VVGGGPAGSSCAYWLAEAGWDVAVVEKKRFPREKTCGDGLTPRAVRQLADMGVESELAGAHRYHGLRAGGFGHIVELAWPEHPVFPDYGYTITRHDLDGLVADRAAKAGATVLQGTEALEPLLRGPTAEDATWPDGRLPRCDGAVVRTKDTGATSEIRARYVVVADGSLSRFGRALGTSRDKGMPQGMALRGYYESPRHDDPFIESHLDIRDPDGEVVPGYGWIFPLGDGRVNVGVGLLSTDRRWRGANTTKLMENFVRGAPEYWGLSPDTACGPPTGGRLPMGLAVGPHSGPNAVLVGDAGGSINPFNGEGIAYGYETGRMAAVAVGQALSGGGSEALRDFDHTLHETYDEYYRVARAFVTLIGHPEVMRLCVGLGMRSELVMAQLLRIMANLLRPDSLGAAELAYAGMLQAADVVRQVRHLRAALA